MYLTNNIPPPIRRNYYRGLERVLPPPFKVKVKVTQEKGGP
jgi:hypothetical protein